VVPKVNTRAKNLWHHGGAEIGKKMMAPPWCRNKLKITGTTVVLKHAKIYTTFVPKHSQSYHWRWGLSSELL